MSRIAKRQSISPKVYRHFAVVTIAVTALLGFFASGENRDAAAEALAASAAEPKARPSVSTSLSVAFGAGQHKGSFGSDAGVANGGGVEDGEDGGFYTPAGTWPKIYQPPVPMSPAMQLGGLASLPDTPPPGMPIEVYLQLKREKARLKKAGPQMATQSDMTRMTEESRQRSGGENLPAEQAD